jgi:hypothetical protein
MNKNPEPDPLAGIEWDPAFLLEHASSGRQRILLSSPRGGRLSKAGNQTSGLCPLFFGLAEGQFREKRKGAFRQESGGRNLAKK